MTVRRRAALLLATAFSLSLGANARADDTSDIQSILSERVITTASTTAQKASVAPALSTTITGDDLRLFGLHTLAEAINFLSVGVVTGDPLGPPDVGSRGVLFANDGGKHFLLLINGHAVNDPLYGTARFDEGAGVPIDMIDHIEVIVGPGSVLYGSNAMMGVINVFTKSAAEYQGGHVAAEYESSGLVRASAGTGILFKLGGAPSEITAGVEYVERYGPDLEFPDQRFPNNRFGAPFAVSFGPSEPTNNVWGGTVKNSYFTQAPSGVVRFRSGDFEVNVLASAYRHGLPYATSEQSVAFDDSESYELERSLRIDVRHEATISTLVQLTSRAYADSYDRRSRVDVPGTLCQRSIAECEYYDAGVTRWVGLEERLSLNWLRDQSLVTLLGVDARERWASAKEDLLDSSTGQPLAPTAGHIDTNASLIAPYVQQTWTPTRWLDLNGGARLDADSRFTPVVSPRGAFAVRPWVNGTLKVVYSQAFRAPTWAETVLANYQVAPSDGAEPETVRSIEASFEQRVATHRVLFGVFRSWWENLIEATALSAPERARLQASNQLPPIVGSLEQFQNIANVDNYGWTGSVDGSFAEGHLLYGASATGAFTRQDDGNGPELLAVAPQLFGNAHVAYALGGNAPAPALAVSYQGPRPVDRDSPTGASLPAAPGLADFRFTLTGAVPGFKGLSYRASADYITAARSPYSAGPDLGVIGGATSALPLPGFAPIEQFCVFFGIRYDFFTGSQAAKRGVP
jgi:outer membrane receptor for ferrienterochelin and colicins